MTDIENIIINRIDNVLSQAGYKDILGSTYQDLPANFPWVFFEQIDTYENPTYHKSSRTNNYDTVTFEADIYSNKKTNQKRSAKRYLHLSMTKWYRWVLSVLRLSRCDLQAKCIKRE